MFLKADASQSIKGKPIKTLNLLQDKQTTKRLRSFSIFWVLIQNYFA
jgi:hypothetical protein